MSDNISLGELAKEMAGLIARELVALQGDPAAPTFEERLRDRADATPSAESAEFDALLRVYADKLCNLSRVAEQRAARNDVTAHVSRLESDLAALRCEHARIIAARGLSRAHFHATYNGGYHEREDGDGREAQRQAFHHGMDCVFNAIERNTPE